MEAASWISSRLEAMLIHVSTCCISIVFTTQWNYLYFSIQTVTTGIDTLKQEQRLCVKHYIIPKATSSVT